LDLCFKSYSSFKKGMYQLWREIVQPFLAMIQNSLVHLSPYLSHLAKIAWYWASRFSIVRLCNKVLAAFNWKVALISPVCDAKYIFANSTSFKALCSNLYLNAFHSLLILVASCMALVCASVIQSILDFDSCSLSAFFQAASNRSLAFLFWRTSSFIYCFRALGLTDEKNWNCKGEWSKTLMWECAVTSPPWLHKAKER